MRTLVARVGPQHIQMSSGYRTFESTINSVEAGVFHVGKGVELIGKHYDSGGLIGLDGFFSPYYIGVNHDTHQSLPSWGNGSGFAISAYSLNPFNPNHMFQNETGVNKFNSSGFFESGHNISFLNTFSGVGNYTSADLNAYKEIAYDNRPDYSKIKSVALRSPVIIAGWGYDIHNNMVPAMESGALREPSLWRVGPLDVRWDEERGVWGGPQPFYLIKFTNVYNPSCFSYEVDRSVNRGQYNRLAPSGYLDIDPSGTIYDPEYLAYEENPNNTGCYEYLDFSDIKSPMYEAFIVRRTYDDTSSSNDYNLWYDDLNDCGHVTNPCPPSDTRGSHGSSSKHKKILVENPLRQSFDVGDLAISINTGKKKRVSGSSFVGGSGVGASAQFTVDENGQLSFQILSSGQNYTSGAFAIYKYPYVGLSVTTTSGNVTGGVINGPTSNYIPNSIYPVSIYPKNASSQYEELPIHWVLQAEFKSQQFVTHVEADNGILQTCTIKGQLQGFKTCEHCGENNALVNNFI